MRAVCAAYGVPFYRVSRVGGPELQAVLDRHPADLLISISCPQIIGKAVRQRFPRGCINVHSAPLPLYRGLMPTFWALRNGETQTGVTVHEIDSKLDNGAILAQQMVPITPADTWDSLVRKTKRAGAHLLADTVLQMETADVERKPNPEESGTYFSFPGPEDRKAFLALNRRFF
jgi:methionyl-tRNA formyltransferase